MIKLSDRVESLAESVTLALNAQAKLLLEQGKQLVNLSAGEPDCQTPEYIVDFVKDKLDQNKYTSAGGLPELRQAVAKYYQNYYRSNWVEPENVLMTAGAKPALTAIFLGILNQGDEVIIPKPAWVSYSTQISIAGGMTKFVETKANFDLDISSIKAAISHRTKAIIINSPNNPSGQTYSETALKKLVKLLANRDIYIISDDIYSRLVFEEIKLPLDYINPRRLIVVNGFSKSQALTGWRIGYLIANKQVQSKINSLLSHTNGNAPLPAQYAALAALERQDRPPFLTQLTKKRELTANLLAKIKAIDFIKPSGGFYYFVDVRHYTSDTSKFCQDLLQRYGVVVVPGEAFECPGFFRLSFATSRESIISGIDKIAKFIKEIS